jgi:hypothetical protein
LIKQPGSVAESGDDADSCAEDEHESGAGDERPKKGSARPPAQKRRRLEGGAKAKKGETVQTLRVKARE